MPELDPDLNRIKADADQVEQVLINLIKNAQDALVASPRVVEDGASIQVRSSNPRVTGRGVIETVLVVENDEDVLRYTRKILESGGYKVLQAIDGEAALSLAKEQCPGMGIRWSCSMA